jgi:hypothetical protein
MKTQIADNRAIVGEGRLVSSIVPEFSSVSPDSVFSDPDWLMSKHVTLPGIPSYSKHWDFRSCPGFPNGFSLALAEYAYSRHLHPIPQYEEAVAWLTIHNELTVLREFCNFCFEQGCYDPSQLDSDMYERFLKQLINLADESGGDNERVNYKLKTIYKFWEHRDRLSTPHVERPFKKPVEKVLLRENQSHSSGENRTPSIPDPIYAAIMAASLDYVLLYSSVITDTCEQLRSKWLVIERQQIRSKSTREQKLSLAGSGILATTSSYWRKQQWLKPHDLYVELQQLRSACENIILAYSGMRVSEYLSLEDVCLVKDTASDGSIIHYVDTILHKHRQNGKRDTWVVIDEVVRAIEIMVYLTSRPREESGCKFINLTASSNGLFSVRGSYAGGVRVMTQATIIYHMNKFASRCNSLLNRPPIPQYLNAEGKLQDWEFNPRQFRRTLARYIARQPFGIIAGMIQYKHVCSRMFEGYAGNDPEWARLLEEEQVLAEIDILEELAMDVSGGNIAGGHGDKLLDDFRQEFRGRAEDFSAAQIVKWLRGSSKTFYTGKLNFCSFDQSKALCIENTSEKSSPILNSCDPTVCKNACVTKRHAPLWRAQLLQAEQHLNHPETNVLQRTVLEREVTRLRAVVTIVEPTE